MNTGYYARLPQLFAAVLLLALEALAPRAVAAPLPSPPSDQELRAEGLRGLELLMDGDPDAAIGIFRQIQAKDPQSPLGYLLEADALWWKVYYETGNLVDPDVFDVVSAPVTAYDAHLTDLLDTAIDKAQARIQAREDLARSYFYLGMAHAIQARLVGLRGKDLPTARAGKKMRSALMKAVELDPHLTDAYLGLGIYNYFVDTLPTIVKILSIFIALPGGSRELGLKQLEDAAQKGELTRSEAKFYLAKNYSRGNERQYGKSLQFFEQLRQEHPHNPLWRLIIGSLHFRLGHTEQGEALYREVYKQTAGESSEVKQAVHRAARAALQRRHPGEKIE
jgi:tetratricopeptide (TPR) repeat protein